MGNKLVGFVDDAAVRSDMDVPVGADNLQPVNLLADINM